MKKPADAVYVRDQILATVAAARASPVPAQRLADAKSFDRYAFARTLDSTERIAQVISGFAPYRRSYDTVNTYYRTLTASPAGRRPGSRAQVLHRSGLIVTTLSKEPLPPAIEKAPALDRRLRPAVAVTSAEPAAAVTPPACRQSRAASGDVRLIEQKSVLPQLDVKLLFTVGSAHDPAGKEGLAALTAAMIADAGSRSMTIDQIDADAVSDGRLVRRTQPTRK